MITISFLNDQQLDVSDNESLRDAFFPSVCQKSNRRTTRLQPLEGSPRVDCHSSLYWFGLRMEQLQPRADQGHGCCCTCPWRLELGKRCLDL